MPWRRSTCDAFDGADDEMFAYLETCIGSTRACRIDAIDCVCLACPPEAGMHMRWTDHACNMINNYVCFMLVDMRVPCMTTQPTSRVRMGSHKSHAMLARAQSDEHDDAQQDA